MKLREGSHLEEPTPEDLGNHRGEWVAIVGRHIVAYGADPVKVFTEASRTHHEPVVFRVPSGEVMIL